MTAHVKNQDFSVSIVRVCIPERYPENILKIQKYELCTITFGKKHQENLETYVSMFLTGPTFGIIAAFTELFHDLFNILPNQQAQNLSIAFVQRLSNVFDVGPALYKCYTNILRLLEMLLDYKVSLAATRALAADWTLNRQFYAKVDALHEGFSHGVNGQSINQSAASSAVQVVPVEINA